MQYYPTSQQPNYQQQPQFLPPSYSQQMTPLAPPKPEIPTIQAQRFPPPFQPPIIPLPSNLISADKERYTWSQKKDKMPWGIAESLEIERIVRRGDLKSVLFYMNHFMNANITRDDAKKFGCKGALHAFLILQLGTEYLLNENNRLEREIEEEKPEKEQANIDLVNQFNEEVRIFNEKIEKREVQIEKYKEQIKELKDRINQIKNVHDKKKLKEQKILMQMKTIKEENSKLKMQLQNQNLSKKQPKNDINQIVLLSENEINDYEKLEEISYNNNGKVVKVAKKQIFVLKVMNVKNVKASTLKLFFNEYEIMNLLNHPNIIKTYGICLDSANEPPSMVIEYCKGNLDEVIKNKKYSKVEIAFAIYQIAEGMKYVHCKKIIHRDLKPNNILIATDGTIRIADFGISKLVTPEEQNTVGIGTQKFMAPEILNEEDYNEKVDVYSFGVIAYFALNNSEMPVVKMCDIMKGKKAEFPSSFTSFAKKLIDSCWNFDPNDRPSFKDICEQLNKNCHLLFDLSSIEISQLKGNIENHKLRIPVYE